MILTYTPRQCIEAAEHPALQDHPAVLKGLSNASPAELQHLCDEAYAYELAARIGG